MRVAATIVVLVAGVLLLAVACGTSHPPPERETTGLPPTKVGQVLDVDVARDGEYEIELRRWPKEDGQALNEGPGVKASSARLTIGDVDQTKAVDGESPGVTFEVKLKAGPTRLQTWLSDDDGASSACSVLCAFSS